MSAPPVSDAMKAFSARKLAVADRIRHDGRLSASIRMIGAEICSLANFHTGYAWAPEKYLAEKLCVTTRTIKRAVATLKAAGYLTVEKSGRSNRYRPVFEAAQKVTNCPLSKTGQGTECHLSEENTGHSSPEQGTKTPENRGQKGPPISLGISLGSPGPAEASAPGPGGALGRAPVPGASDQLGGFAQQLERRLGKDQFGAWMGKAVFISEEGDLLTLAAPTKFIANHLKNFFGGSIMEVWQSERPHIARLEVIVARALETAAPARAPASPEAIAATADAKWLDDVGIGLVREALHEDSGNAKNAIKLWLRRCGNDAAGLRKIIQDASARGLTELHFRDVVRQRTRDLLHADQITLPLKPAALRSA